MNGCWETPATEGVRGVTEAGMVMLLSLPDLEYSYMAGAAANALSIWKVLSGAL